MPYEQNSRKYLDRLIFIVVTVAILAILLFLWNNNYEQSSHYKKAIDTASSNPADHAALLSYLTSRHVGIFKSSAIFISFVVILIGSLYVLRAAPASFSAAAEVGQKFRIVLSTASPGLAMVLIGAILVVFSLYKKSTVTYNKNIPGYAHGEAPEPFVNDRRRIEPQTTEMEASSQ